MDILSHVQSAIANASYPGRRLIDSGSFRAIIDPRRSVVFVNYAVVIGQPGDPERDLANLKELFEKEHRVPRIEYAREFAPSLETALVSAGFKKEHELPLMACTPEIFSPRSTVEVDVRTLGPDDDVRIYYKTANRAFDVQMPVGEQPVIKREADKETGTLHIAIGCIDGAPAGCACLGPNWELSGVGVMPEFRRRGVASSVSSALLAEHFKTCNLAWLTAEDGVAEALYRSLGFKSVGTHEAWAVVPHAL